MQSCTMGQLASVEKCDLAKGRGLRISLYIRACCCVYTVDESVSCFELL